MLVRAVDKSVNSSRKTWCSNTGSDKHNSNIYCHQEGRKGCLHAAVAQLAKAFESHAEGQVSNTGRDRHRT